MKQRWNLVKINKQKDSILVAHFFLSLFFFRCDDYLDNEKMFQKLMAKTAKSPKLCDVMSIGNKWKR